MQVGLSDDSSSKGTGFAELWPQMAALAVLTTCILSFSILRFHKSLD
jgi:ABC-2 type transport system permease protein